MARPAQPRPFPMEPLLRAAGRRSYIPERSAARDRPWGKNGATSTGYMVLVEICGMSQSEVSKARTLGLTDAQADHCAVRLGMHPAEIWGSLWLEVEQRALFDQIRREVGNPGHGPLRPWRTAVKDRVA